MSLRIQPRGGLHSSSLKRFPSMLRRDIRCITVAASTVSLFALVSEVRYRGGQNGATLTLARLARGTCDRFDPSRLPGSCHSLERTSSATIEYSEETGQGNDNTHCRTGTRGETWSTKCAAVSTMRCAPHDGQKPRHLDEKAAVDAQALQCNRWARHLSGGLTPDRAAFADAGRRTRFHEVIAYPNPPRPAFPDRTIYSIRCSSCYSPLANNLRFGSA